MKPIGRGFEDDFAQEVGEPRHRMSGAQLGENDNPAGGFDCELKATAADSFSLTPELWKKAAHRAGIKGQLPAFAIRLSGGFRIIFLRRKDFYALWAESKRMDIHVQSEQCNTHGNYVAKRVHLKDCISWSIQHGNTFALEVTLGGNLELVAVTWMTFMELVEATR